jgi:hypothetical protein
MRSTHMRKGACIIIRGCKFRELAPVNLQYGRSSLLRILMHAQPLFALWFCVAYNLSLSARARANFFAENGSMNKRCGKHPHPGLFAFHQITLQLWISLLADKNGHGSSMNKFTRKMRLKENKKQWNWIIYWIKLEPLKKFNGMNIE